MGGIFWQIKLQKRLFTSVDGYGTPVVTLLSPFLSPHFSLRTNST